MTSLCQRRGKIEGLSEGDEEEEKYCGEEVKEVAEKDATLTIVKCDNSGAVGDMEHKVKMIHNNLIHTISSSQRGDISLFAY